MQIGIQLEEMLSYVDRSEAMSPEISGWTVGQQIEHCCLTMRSTAAAMRRNRITPSELELTPFGRQVFRRGVIERGRAQAPGPVAVQDQPTAAHLRQSLSKAAAAVQTLDPDALSGYFEHPFFGVLDPPHTIRFVEIHNEHHLAIIRDILALDTPDS